MENKSQKKPKQVDWPMVWGILLTILGAAAAIGVSVWWSHSADPLWATFILIWGISRVRYSDRKYQWKPAVLGLVMGVSYAALGGVAYYVQNNEVLWAMLLVNWLADAII